jgi:hypothetical protein
MIIRENVKEWPFDVNKNSAAGKRYIADQVGAVVLWPFWPRSSQSAPAL